MPSYQLNIIVSLYNMRLSLLSDIFRRCISWINVHVRLTRRTTCLAVSAGCSHTCSNCKVLYFGLYGISI